MVNQALSPHALVRLSTCETAERKQIHRDSCNCLVEQAFLNTKHNLKRKCVSRVCASNSLPNSAMSLIICYWENTHTHFSMERNPLPWLLSAASPCNVIFTTTLIVTGCMKINERKQHVISSLTWVKKNKWKFVLKTSKLLYHKITKDEGSSPSVLTDGMIWSEWCPCL